jgi:hypothetical protein
MLGLRRGLSHPVTDKGVEHFTESGENGVEPRSDAPFLRSGIKSDRGHRRPPHESNDHDVPMMS